MRKIDLKNIKPGRFIHNLLPAKKISFNKRALRDAGIDVLIHDERWSRLFSYVNKTSSIIKAEELLNSKIEEKTRLRMENNMIRAEKQDRLNKIEGLAARANNDDEEFAESAESARAEISEYEARVKEIDEREPQIEQRDEELDREIRRINLSLLETTVSYLYHYMNKSRTRIEELDIIINDMRETLKERVSERVELDIAVNETYNFLHGLLGAQQIESVDDHFTPG